MMQFRAIRSTQWINMLTVVIASAGLSAGAQTTAEIDRLRMHADAGRDERALQALIQAADMGNIDAQRAAGEVLIRSTDTKLIVDGLTWLEHAAQHGDVRAMLALGKAHLLGGPHHTPDYAKALRWLTHATVQKSPQAAHYLGLMHKSGYGVAIDKATALRHFEFAATQEVADAMYELGSAYRHGDGVDEDSRAAMRWYLRAAALEHPLAIQEIANAYARGDSMLPQSDLQAALMLRAIDHALKHPKSRP
jgi:uncharacterized protein